MDTRLDGELIIEVRDSTGRPLTNANVLLLGLAPAGMSFFTPVLHFRAPNDPAR